MWEDLLFKFTAYVSRREGIPFLAYSYKTLGRLRQSLANIIDARNFLERDRIFLSLNRTKRFHYPDGRHYLITSETESDQNRWTKCSYTRTSSRRGRLVLFEVLLPWTFKYANWCFSNRGNHISPPVPISNQHPSEWSLSAHFQHAPFFLNFSLY